MENTTVYPHHQRDLATVSGWHKSSRCLWVRPWMGESTRLVHRVNYYFSLTVHRWWLEEIRPSQLVPGLKRYLHTPIGNFPLNKMSKNKLCRWVLRTSLTSLAKQLRDQASSVTMVPHLHEYISKNIEIPVHLRWKYKIREFNHGYENTAIERKQQRTTRQWICHHRNSPQ